jgi:hypothetical protein
MRFILRMMEERAGAAGLQPASQPVFLRRGLPREAGPISDSGRIRNELQTLVSEALDHVGDKIRVNSRSHPPEVIPKERQKKLLEILRWYKQEHPVWFHWLEVSEAQVVSVGIVAIAPGLIPDAAAFAEEMLDDEIHHLGVRRFRRSGIDLLSSRLSRRSGARLHPAVRWTAPPVADLGALDFREERASRATAALRVHW